MHKSIKSLLLLVFTMMLIGQSRLSAYDLVNLRKFNPKLCIDLRYASEDNTLGMPIYPSEDIYVDANIATRLGRVQRALEKETLGLMVLEGYRPPSVQCILDNVISPETGCNYFQQEAPHYRRGVGVDVMVYYLDGQPISVPTAYQERSPRAYRDFPCLTAAEYHNSYILEKYMTENGFVPQREKWWHFDLKGWESMPDLNIEYDELMYK
jgi:zinc D-Ala-D-Ala dipeptidase